MDAFDRWQEWGTFFWDKEPEGPWAVTVGLREIEGRMECVGFAITQKEPPEGKPYPPPPILTAKMVRTIPIGQFIDRTRRAKAGSAAIVAGLFEDEGRPDEAAWAREYGNRFQAKASGRPRMYGDEHYRQVASVYAEGWRMPEGAPTKHIAESFHVSHATAARWVRVCRDKGLLGETTKRKAGGILPPQQEEGTK